MFSSFYQQESFNVKPRYDCIQTNNNIRTSTKYNNEANCTANNGTWLLVYSYLEKAPGKDEFPSKRLSSSLTFRLGYLTQSSCEQASTSQYQYKWASKYCMLF
jgi:hypothetical protein